MYLYNIKRNSNIQIERTHTLSIKSSPGLFDEQIPTDNSPHAERGNCTRAQQFDERRKHQRIVYVFDRKFDGLVHKSDVCS